MGHVHFGSDSDEELPDSQPEPSPAVAAAPAPAAAAHAPHHPFPRGALQCAAALRMDFDSKDTCYVFELAHSPALGLVAATLSNRRIKLFALRWGRGRSGGSGGAGRLAELACAACGDILGAERGTPDSLPAPTSAHQPSLPLPPPWALLPPQPHGPAVHGRADGARRGPALPDHRGSLPLPRRPPPPPPLLCHRRHRARLGRTQRAAGRGVRAEGGAGGDVLVRGFQS